MTKPSGAPFRRPRWAAVLTGTFHSAVADNIGLVAAGVAYFEFLGMVPLMALVVLCYGLFAETGSIAVTTSWFTRIMPAEAAVVLHRELVEVVSATAKAKGVGVALSFTVALVAARSAVSAMLAGIHVAFEQPDTRSFVRTTAFAVAATLVAVGVIAVTLAIAAAVHRILQTALGDIPGLRAGLFAAMGIASVALGGLVFAAAYRHGPSGPHRGWREVLPGGALAALGATLATSGFAAYVKDIGNYDATYGSLGAIAVLLIWFYLTSFAVLLGAEFNRQLEKAREDGQCG